MIYTLKFLFAFVIYYSMSFVCLAVSIQQDTLMLEFTYKKGGNAYLFLEDIVRIECYDKTKIKGTLSGISDTLITITNKQNTYFVKPQNIKKIEQYDFSSPHADRQEEHLMALTSAIIILLGVFGLGHAWISPNIPTERRMANFVSYLVASLVGGLSFWWVSVHLRKRTKSFNLAKYWSIKAVKQPAGKDLKKLKRRAFYR